MEKKTFNHPSNISLFNLYSQLHFPTEKGKTVKQLVDEKSNFFEWALISSSIFCFDDYTYDYLKEIGFPLSKKAIEKQLEKREKFRKDTIKFNETYDNSQDIDLNIETVKLYRLDYRLGFGEFADYTVEELIEMSPSRIEFFIQMLPWFGLTQPAISKLKSLEPDFLFLASTHRILQHKYNLAPEMMKGSAKEKSENDLVDADLNDSAPYRYGDYRQDRNENRWIDVFGQGDEANAAYWNTD